MMNKTRPHSSIKRTNPLVSILTPVFNQERYIEETIRSVLNQTYENWEWIILDDGSTDGTGDIIKRFRNSRIKYVFQEHLGTDHLVKTFNKALSLCNGNLIAMLDGDDYWPDYKLELQVKDFDSPDIVLSYGESILVNEDGKKVNCKLLPSDPGIAGNRPVGSSLKLFLLRRMCFITNSTVMLNKETLLSIGGFIDAKGLTQDFPTWTRLSLEGRFAANPVCLGYWRMHLASDSYQAGPEFKMKAGISFLREFVLLNKQKLQALGVSCDMDMFEEHWSRLNPSVRYHSRTLVALSCGSFKEARTAFKKFLENDASLKQNFIYFLVILSSLLRFDVVNPLVTFKARLAKKIRANLGSFLSRNG